MLKLNKKGEEEEGLMGNTLGVVLAVAAILIVVGFVYVALIRITADTELESASSLMNVIEAKIKALSPGQSLNHTIQGFKTETADRHWYLVGWGKNQDSPDKCFFNNCICICAGYDKDACQNRGICRFFEVDDIEVKDLKVIHSGGFYVHDPVGTTIDDSTKYIPIPNNLLVVEIKKEQNKISVLHYTEDYIKYEYQLPKDFAIN